MRTNLAFILGILLIASAGSHAAEFTLLQQKDLFCDKIKGEQACLAISMTGEITIGDTQKLQALMARTLALNAQAKRVVRIGTLFLDSPGGNVSEAMNIGRSIRSLQISTVVTATDRCASSCVLVLAAGVIRAPMGTIEVHSFYAPSLLGSGEFEKGEVFYKELSERIGGYLKDMRVSSALLDEMIRIPHTQSRKLEWDEIKRLSLIGLDPVYAQTRPPRK